MLDPPSSGLSDFSDAPLRTEPIRPSGEAGDGWGRAAAYDAYADGLHTYAIWSLRDHDAAVDALYCTFVIADRNITQLRQPEQLQPWLYALLRRECTLRPSQASSSGDGSLAPVSGRLRPPGGAADPSGSLASLERNLRRAEFHSLEWPESEGLAPAHREILELTIRHGLDSQGLGLVLGLGQSGRSSSSAVPGGAIGSVFGGGTGGGTLGDGVVGSVGSQGFGVLADAWRELERSLAAVAVAKASREHCAQLAELTFGWSGRLNATLRAPLTDHVDGCTRCQHYLHTVIGTPAAPTILPFVAAPRALREILLDELHDPAVAKRAGIDHGVIAARIQRFALDGFPAIGEPVPVRRRGGRRRASKASAPAKNTATRVTPEVRQVQAVPETAQTPLPRRTPGVNRPRTDSSARPRSGAMADGLTDEHSETSGVYSAPGSWAARVLPADSAAEWRPLADESLSALPSSAGAARSRPGGSGAPGSEARPRHGGAADARSRRVAVSASGPGSASALAANGETRPMFISTPSGRFAFRAPNAAETGPTGVGAAAEGRAGAGGTVTAPLSRFATPEPEAPRGPDGRPRARHKSRPVKQAVLSAVALGAVGAAAAASAALLGLASENHSPQLLGTAPQQDPIGTTGRTGGLTVSVSTPAAPGTSSGAHSSTPVGSGRASGVSGTVGNPTSGAPGSGPGVNPADFHVSVNQRAADPNSVMILLRNTGSTPIAWSAAARDRWIVLSQSSGTLAAGRSAAITATATSAAPGGQWTSTVTFSPGGAVVTLHGGSTPMPPTGSAPASSTPPGSATPSSPPSATSTPTPTPTPTPSSSSSSAGGVSPSAIHASGSRPAGGGGSGGTPTPPAASASPSTVASTSASQPAGSGPTRRHR